MATPAPFSSSAAALWPTVDPDHGSDHTEEQQPREDLGQDVEDQYHSGTVLQGLPVEVQHSVTAGSLGL